MARRKSRYSKANIKPTLKDESLEEMRKDFPTKLVDLFVKLHDSGFEDIDYKKYRKEADKFLKTPDDKIEQGKLIVQLVKATADLVKENTNEKAKKEKTVKTPKAKRLASRKRPLPEKGRDGQSKESNEQKSV